MTSNDTIRDSGYHPDGLNADLPEPTPSAMTPQTAAKVSRAKALAAQLRRYAAAVAAFAGAAGLSLGSIFKGVGLDDWMQRWGFWPTFAAVSLGVLLLILLQMRQSMADALAALERRSDQQMALMEQRKERQEAHFQEIVELIMDRHSASQVLLAERIEALEKRMDEQTGPRQKVTGPQRQVGYSTPPTGSRG